MRVFAHGPHIYEDRATHTTYVLPVSTWREIPDGVGQLLIAAHPNKLCDVSGEDNPDSHECLLTLPARLEYEHRMMEAPPMTTAAGPKLSRQRRTVLKHAKRRSRLARLKGKEQ